MSPKLSKSGQLTISTSPGMSIFLSLVIKVFRPLMLFSSINPSGPIPVKLLISMDGISKKPNNDFISNEPTLSSFIGGSFAFSSLNDLSFKFPLTDSNLPNDFSL